ncbi:MAG: hypothetical protein HQ491_10840 [Bacteroidetes bacterium]|nr:hypothetical protein [Bacteroidota bacterium]
MLITRIRIDTVGFEKNGKWKQNDTLKNKKDQGPHGYHRPKIKLLKQKKAIRFPDR